MRLSVRSTEARRGRQEPTPADYGPTQGYGAGCTQMTTDRRASVHSAKAGIVPADPADTTHWRPILVVYAVGVMASLQVGRVAPAAESLQQTFGVGLAAIGVMVALINLAPALLGAAAGTWVDRLGPRGSLTLGCGILAAAAMAAAAPMPWEALLALRVVEGLGYLLIVVAAPTVIAAEARGRGLARGMALWGTFFTLGLSAAAFAGGVVVQRFDWAAWFAASGVLGLAALAAVRLALPDRIRGARAAGKAVAARALPGACWWLCAAFFFVAFLSLGLLSLVPLLAAERLGVDEGAAGGLAGIVALSSLAGSILYGAAAPHARRSVIVVTASALILIGLVPLVTHTRDMVLLTLPLAVSVAASGATVSFVFAQVPLVAATPRQIPTINGMIVQMGSVGSLTGPPVIAFVVAQQGWQGLGGVIAITAMLSALLLLGAIHRVVAGGQSHRPGAAPATGANTSIQGGG